MAARTDPWKVVGDLFLKLINRAARHPERMSETEWVVLRVWMLLGEVSNGGFDQYFSNSSGGHARPTLQALKTIGETRAADVLDRAMKVFPEPAADRELRSRQMKRLPKKRRAQFETLDRELWDRGQTVVEKLAAFIKANKKDIRAKKERGGRRYE